MKKKLKLDITKVNSILLVLGFAFQSFVFQSFVSFNGIDSENSFNIIYLGIWAWLSIPFLILFFANRHLRKTKAARITLFIAVLFVAGLGSFIMFDMFSTDSGPLSGLVFIFLPCHEIVLSIIAVLIVIPLNFVSKTKNNLKE